jgi:putative transposase
LISHSKTTPSQCTQKQASLRKTITTEHQRKLPHFHHVGATYFITSHLEGSVPFDVLKKLRDARDKTIAEIIRQISSDIAKQLYLVKRQYFLEYDDLLDRCLNSPNYLKDPAVAKILVDALHKYDGKHYNLVAYTIMPNHFHVILDYSIQVPDKQLFNIDKYIGLPKSMDLIKGRSSRFSNLLLDRTGNPFWDDEYHDRYIRNFRHFVSAVDYVKNNPVKAKLCLHWMEHPFTWVREDYMQMKLIFPR